MRAHNVIIVSSGRCRFVTAGELDRLIRAVRALKKTPILVLGPDGDDLMRLCTEIEHCEIVFDPNFEGQLFSSIKAGLHATNGAAFVLPLGARLLDPALWPQLESELLRNETGDDLICPLDEKISAGETDGLYPRLVTAQGVRTLRELSSASDWTDLKQVSQRFVNVQSPRPAES